VPILVALGLVTIASVAAFVPQYGTHKILGVSNNGTTNGTGTDNSTGGTQGTDATQGKTVVGSGSGGSNGSGGGGGGGGGANDCAHGKNAGATDVGVTSTSVHIASTIVTTGIGQGFLGQAVSGMKAAINQVNQAGGVCGRHITIETLNDNWERDKGAGYIGNYISQGNVFALVGEPDSEGLDAAWQNGSIDKAGIPVVGTDGMLASQYNDPWIWPVAASTVTNMHIIADYAKNQLHAHRVGIVYDSIYKFGKEGAAAFAAQVKRESGGETLGMDTSKSCAGGYCGISPSSTDYSGNIHDFNAYCSGSTPCDVVVMLLEPTPALNWMRGEENCNCTWYHTLMGGEPLFDDTFANDCAQDCANMIVWTGYKPDLQPFAGETPVYTFAQGLQAACGTCDSHNEFTEGAYLGTKMFIAALQQVGSNLTRATLRQAMDGATFDLGLSLPLHYGSGLPHQANLSMVAYKDNASGTFNAWSYLSTGFLKDPAPGQDLQSQ